MLRVRFGLPSERRPCRTQVAFARTVQVGNRREQPRHAAGHGDLLMKPAVCRFQSRKLGLTGTGVHRLGSAEDVWRCHARHRVPQRQRLERCPHLRDFRNVRRVKPSNSDTTAWFDDH